MSEVVNERLRSLKAVRSGDKRHVVGNYPAPMPNHAHEGKITQARFKEAMLAQD